MLSRSSWQRALHAFSAPCTAHALGSCCSARWQTVCGRLSSRGRQGVAHAHDVTASSERPPLGQGRCAAESVSHVQLLMYCRCQAEQWRLGPGPARQHTSMKVWKEAPTRFRNRSCPVGNWPSLCSRYLQAVQLLVRRLLQAAQHTMRVCRCTDRRSATAMLSERGSVSRRGAHSNGHHAPQDVHKSEAQLRDKRVSRVPSQQARAGSQHRDHGSGWRDLRGRRAAGKLFVPTLLMHARCCDCGLRGMPGAGRAQTCPAPWRLRSRRPSA